MNGAYPPGQQPCLSLHWYYAFKDDCCDDVIVHNTSLPTSLNTTYQAKISWTDADGNWGLYRNGTWFQKVDSNCCSAELDAGFEDGTLHAVNVQGTAVTFQKKNLQGIWNYDWPAQNVHIDDPPVSAGWSIYGKNWYFSEP